MTQRRSMWALHPKKYGLTGPMKMLSYSSLGFGMDELRTRGWTAKLIEKCIGDEDCRDLVAHWANFTGKNVYFVVRVEKAETMPEFEVDFILFAKRRRLPQNFVDTVPTQDGVGKAQIES